MHKKNDPGNNGAGKLVAIEERKFLFFEEYKKGLTYIQISRKYDVSYAVVSTDIRELLKDLRLSTFRSVSEYRQIQMERLQEGFQAIWPAVLRGRIEAVNVMIRLMEREAKLLGLDAPTKVDIRARIEALAAEDGINPHEAMNIAEAVYKEVSSG